MLKRENITVVFMCYLSPHTVKPNYWFCSQSDGSFSSPSHPGRAVDQLGKFLPFSDENEETKASAVPSELGFSMSGEWYIMGHIREQRLWWTGRMVCWNMSITGLHPAAPPGESIWNLKIGCRKFLLQREATSFLIYWHPTHLHITQH